MTAQQTWPLSGDADELYQRYLVPAMFAPWAQELVALAAPQPGERVLDVACGTGVVARLLAPRVGASGVVVGLDLSVARLSVARSLSPVPGARLEWQAGDALALPFPDNAFDFVCCQQGLQFMPDRPAALREMYRVLVQGGRLALSLWRSIEQSPGAAAMAEALGRHVSREAAAYRRLPFSLGDTEELRALVLEAGFHDVVIRPAVKVLRFPSAEEFVRRYVSGVAPLSRMVAQANEDARAAVIRQVSAALQSYVDADGLAIPKASNLVSARR